MCWGDDVFWQVLDAKSVKATCEAVKNYAANGSITMAFNRKNKIQKLSLAAHKMADKVRSESTWDL